MIPLRPRISPATCSSATEVPPTLGPDQLPIKTEPSTSQSETTATDAIFKNKEDIKPEEEVPYNREETTYRQYGVHILNDNLRTMAARAKVVGLFTYFMNI